MNIVVFTHPAFMDSQSMPRFAGMLQRAYVARGHQVTMWSPQARVFNWVPPGGLKKWAGYIDQYLLFPAWVRRQLRKQPAGTLYIFSDQAQGPWVPLVKHLPHVVHAHDLLALRSALGDIPEHATGWSGRIYQRYIRRGFRQARHFIAISGGTRDDLIRFGGVRSDQVDVVHNGLNYRYAPMLDVESAAELKQRALPIEPDGMLVHVSGGLWYKNVPGVLRLYAAYARRHDRPLPLWMLGDMRPESFADVLAELPPQGQVRFVKGLSNESLRAAYSRARALIFPSLYEGFGWPIIESQACGCPVITTAEPPMNEVGGPAGLYLPRLRASDDPLAWAARGAAVLDGLLSESATERVERSARSVAWSRRFDADIAIDSYLQVYQKALAT
jgi:glycosyltransferase involved in cell wall biosynthesis